MSVSVLFTGNMCLAVVDARGECATWSLGQSDTNLPQRVAIVGGGNTIPYYRVAVFLDDLRSLFLERLRTRV
jgi:hypothetical protein